MPEKRVGKVEHYYPKAKAVAVELEGDLHVGDDIHIVGHGDDVRKKVTSLQLDHVPIQEGHAGEHIGIGLATKVHEGDEVLIEEGPSLGWSAPARTAPRKTSKKAARKRPSGRAGTRKTAKKAARKRPARASTKRRAGKAAKTPKRGSRTGKRATRKTAKKAKATTRKRTVRKAGRRVASKTRRR